MLISTINEIKIYIHRFLNILVRFSKIEFVFWLIGFPRRMTSWPSFPSSTYFESFPENSFLGFEIRICDYVGDSICHAIRNITCQFWGLVPKNICTKIVENELSMELASPFLTASSQEWRNEDLKLTKIEPKEL